MKSPHIMANDAYATFLQSHPELTIAGADHITAHILNEEKIYAKIAIDHAIQFIYEAIQIEQGTQKKSRKQKDDS